MTATHLFFAVMTTAYILIAIQLEERDLMREHPEYAAYRAKVPMLIPFLRRRDRAAHAGMRPAHALVTLRQPCEASAACARQPGRPDASLSVRAADAVDAAHVGAQRFGD